MPEGDAVRRTSDRLNRALAGQVLAGSDLRVPQLATTDLTGATVERTTTHGKHLLTRLTLPDRARLTLHTHLKMEGSWRVIAPGAGWPGPAHEARVVLSAQRAEAIGFRLGLVELLPTAEEESVVGHLGPDLLGAWTADDETTALARLTAAPGRVLGSTLLDQTVVAGLGTIWMSEVCFVQGAHPQAPVASVADPLRLLRRARLMLRSGLEHGQPLTTGDRRDPVWVYRRQRQPCLRCRTTIQAGPVGEAGRERTTYWCPRCQPAT
ncbi:DNA-formamidopyrimidine glycosylase family protein [Nocardioides nitrophenolicus]|uniref:DNA-formamidopyrimidine glycosylase family protein n=1 Tax=Nocardioides nitrophenolicus TaxID=60489 RepID=UPI00195AC42B|nr:DNA-formamidopyrimidine glycosylase family protein [Nocardioides nitrophenolicus]MBM7520096.1 endonuclease-8 [Nocardioides nitrophenolicus]